jgi:hypothetical protein
VDGIAFLKKNIVTCIVKIKTKLLFYIREVFIRLQHENKMLRLQQEGTENERIEELQEQLEQKHRKMNELETEQR